MDKAKLEALIKRVQSEQKKTATDIEQNDGLLRLQQIMASYEGEDRLYSSEDIKKDLETLPASTGLKTGILALDGLTGGFRKKQVITMFAHTKHGKTETAIWLMSLFPELNPVLLPLEQSADELVSQRMERKYSIPHFLAPRRNDTFVLTEWIEERVVEGIAKYNSQMVVIDHLGYIDNEGKDGKWKRENLAYRLGQVMKEIRHIATKWDVIVILLAHISNGDEGKPPQLQDIGNSSDIKKESDTVISIWRKNALKNKIRIYDDKTLLSVLANRRWGKNGHVGLSFDSTTGTFKEENDWVAKMEEMARMEVDVDDKF